MLIGQRNFCNTSVYLFFVIHLPEDGHKSGRNMYEVLLRLINFHKPVFICCFFVIIFYRKLN
jgi:hypothetical protein